MKYLHSVRHYERAYPVSGQSTRSNGGTPLLSVGIPVFNGGRLLVEAIDSILGQTLADFELIIADNASTDETPTICAGYATRDSRIRVIRHRENIGAPRNWNFVARESRGRYFKWASASDRCAPRFLERCVASLEADSDLALCYPRTEFISTSGTGLGVCEADFEVMSQHPEVRFAEVCTRMTVNNAQSGVIRRDILLKTRLDRCYPHGDLALMAELSLLGKFRLLPEVLLYRRADPEALDRPAHATRARANVQARCHAPAPPAPCSPTNWITLPPLWLRRYRSQRALELLGSRCAISTGTATRSRPNYAHFLCWARAAPPKKGESLTHHGGCHDITPRTETRVVGLLGQYSSHNLGDAAIVHEIIRNLRARFPGVSFVGICSRPDDTVRTQGIAAFPISGHGAAYRADGRAWTSVDVSRGATFGGCNSHRRGHSSYRSRCSVDRPASDGWWWTDRRLLGWSYAQPRYLVTWTLLAKLRRLPTAYFCVGLDQLATRMGGFLALAALGGLTF